MLGLITYRVVILLESWTISRMLQESDF